MTDYIVYCVISNFRTRDKELDFGDFKIISVKQGNEAKYWREKIHCKIIPKHILMKEFKNYNVMEDGDITGFDRIINSVRDLLLLFRLYKLGDIYFSDSLIEERGSDNRFSNPYTNSFISYYKYEFGKSEIKEFNRFRDKLINSQGYKNVFFQFAIKHFMSGLDKALFYRIEWLGRVVDYVTALESIFLIDNKLFFLKRMFTERIVRFLGDDSLKPIAKSMYTERSKIVHGSYILRENSECKEKKLDIEKYENLIRQVFIKLFDYNPSTKDEIVNFMQNLYDIPKEMLSEISSMYDKVKKRLDNI